MKRPLVHKRTIYHLPSWQGGDIALPLCQRAAIGWCGLEGRSFSLADIGVNCPCCLGKMAHGLRPNGFRKRVAA